MFVTGEELTKRREDLGLSRDELARELNTTYTTVYRWETENREIPPYLGLALETIERNLNKIEIVKSPNETIPVKQSQKKLDIETVDEEKILVQK